MTYMSTSIELELELVGILVLVLDCRSVLVGDRDGAPGLVVSDLSVDRIKFAVVGAERSISVVVRATAAVSCCIEDVLTRESGGDVCSEVLGSTVSVNGVSVG